MSWRHDQSPNKIKLLWLAALAMGSQAALAILVAFPIGKWDITQER